MPTFKVQGQVYHLIGSLLPQNEQSHSFLQIYFISDYSQQADVRCGIFFLPRKQPRAYRDKDLLLALQNMLHQCNSYVRSFKFTLETSSSPAFVRTLMPLQCSLMQ